MTGKVRDKKYSLSSFQLIILGFAGVILVGAVLLCLPFSSSSGKATPFGEAIFTATSAACVTGLVVRDTATYWSAFGQAVILILIQIGGLGVVTVASSLTVLAGKKVSLRQRSTMQEAMSTHKIGGVVKFSSFVVKATFAVEAIGAAALMPVFIGEFGANGIWKAVFHSVSAFCNAGFDLMGTEGGEYASLTSYAANWYVNAVIMILIVVGGIGFLTWRDVAAHKFRIKKYSMQSKVVLVTSAVLIILPAAYFFFGEYSALPAGERTAASLFQSVTTRTAGFNTADLTTLGGAGRVFMIVLMLIGGSPGSTAGGMKTTTFAVMLASSFSVFRRRSDSQFFGRRISTEVVKNASAVFMMYLTLFLAGGTAISIAEGIPIGTCLFETASAVGTVGLTLGITPALGAFSRVILIILMFLGRVGALTMVYAAVSGSKIQSRYPLEDITVG